MDYSSFYPKDHYTFYHATYPAVAKSNRTLSFSSSSSSSGASSSFFPDDSPSLPETPLHFASGRVPFCWEKCPGIPKPTTLSLMLTHDQEHTNPSPKKISDHISISPSRNVHCDQKPKSPLVKVLLPPPPASSSSRRLNFNEHSIIRRSQTFSGSTRLARKDPFFAAFIECSKNGGGGGDDYDDQELLGGGGHKVSKSIGDRIGFVGMYASCKQTCSVSESIVYLPRSSAPARPPYDLLNRRR